MGYLYSNGKLSRSILAKAIVYFGWKNVISSVLETTEDLSKAQELEKHYIAKYKSTETQFGFNTQDGGKDGYTYNNEFIKNVKGQRRSINTEFKMGHKCFTCHPFKCLENGKIYMNREEAERDLGIKLNHIYEVCKGRRKNCRGFTFKYVEDC